MDRSSFKHRLVIALAALVFAPVFVLAQTQSGMMNGEWAMHGSQPRILSHLTVHANANGTTLDVVQYARGQQAPLSRYHPEEGNFMHLVLIRDDFRAFEHLHPDMTDGHFIAPVALSSGHRYYVYADSDPVGIGGQVFRFTLTEGTPPLTQHTTVAASAPTALVGPYTVRISTTRLAAGQPSTLLLHFQKAGAPATDITPYRGAAAHATVMNTSDLTYMDIDPRLLSKRSPSSMQLKLPPIGSHAAYKLWLQFRGGGTVYTAPFTLVAS